MLAFVSMCYRINVCLSCVVVCYHVLWYRVLSCVVVCLSCVIMCYGIVCCRLSCVILCVYHVLCVDEQWCVTGDSKECGLGTLDSIMDSISGLEF